MARHYELCVRLDLFAFMGRITFINHSHGVFPIRTFSTYDKVKSYVFFDNHRFAKTEIEGFIALK